MVKKKEKSIKGIKNMPIPVVIMDRVHSAKETDVINFGINILRKKEIMIMATKKELTTTKTAATKKPLVKKETATKKTPEKKPAAKKEVKKVVSVKKAVKKDTPKPPVKKLSRRLTNKERDAVSAVLVSYMLIPEFNSKSEEGKLIMTALDKIRVI